MAGTTAGVCVPHRTVKHAVRNIQSAQQSCRIQRPPESYRAASPRGVARTRSDPLPRCRHRFARRSGNRKLVRTCCWRIARKRSYSGGISSVLIEQRFLIDSGVANNTPVSVAASLMVSQMIVLPTEYTCAHREPPRGVVAIALHALNQVIIRQLVTDLERFLGMIEISVVPPLCPLSVSTYDFSRASELIDRSAAATESWLTDGGLDRRYIPHELPLHRHSRLLFRFKFAKKSIPCWENPSKLLILLCRYDYFGRATCENI